MKKLIILLLLLLPSVGFGFSGGVTAKIDRILFYEDASLIYIYPEGGIPDAPACHGSNGDYISYSTKRPMAKEYISALLSAMHAKKRVGFRIANACTDQSVSVTLMYFTIYAD